MKIVKLFGFLLLLTSCNQYLGTIEPDYIPQNEVEEVFLNKTQALESDDEFKISEVFYPDDKKFDLKEKGFGIEVEVLSKFLKLNREIIEIPISYFGRSYEEGKKIMLSDGLNIAYKIVKYSKFLGIFNILNIFKQQN